MEFEQIIKLIQAVSDSKLSVFTYEAGGVKLSMECGQVQQIAVSEPVFAAAQATADGALGNLQAAAVNPAVLAQLQSAAVNAVSAAPQQAEQTGGQEPAKEGQEVKSPLVGTFYAAPSEDAQPFVQVGDRVKKGQVLAIVEAMKLMNEIESEFDGTVEEILVENGQPVEYGQPLFRIK